MEFQHESNRIYLNNESSEMIAEVTFPEIEPGIYCINHTYVSDVLRGRGVAGQLVAAAVEQIETAGGTVTATCSYAVRWLEKNRKA